ncbi:MAG TPA: diacylglycerol kinase family protein [Dysgonamonadaceae bacterium]|nr:diacylglycerol kinase family protein [Dysgonamonadaceae bacterium]HOM63376.1 diacylglycerol kinase family protein [Dysgonamonadaceae bacterium]HPD43477.1 diacylglycerol kinase family protein [Dysgonamonadaceae bacterium]
MNHTKQIMHSYFQKRILSFKYAFRGIKVLVHETPNSRIHTILAIMAITLGFVFRISTTEWIAICIVIGLVFAMEAINTAIETLADYACNKQIDSRIAKAKDLAAAGVLMAAIAALVVGIIVFLPKFFQ